MNRKGTCPADGSCRVYSDYAVVHLGKGPKTDNGKLIDLKKTENGKDKNCSTKKDALKRVFKGVSLDSLAVGEKSMVTKMNYVKGNFATTHQHPHEQCGYVVSGNTG